MAQKDDSTPLDAIVPKGPLKQNRRRDLVAMATSTSLHTLVLLFLALWVLPSLSNARMRTLLISAAEDQTYALQSIDIASELLPDMESSTERSPSVTDVFEDIDLDVLDVSYASVKSTLGGGTTPTSLAPTTFLQESLNTSESVEGAVDRVTEELRAKLAKGDLLVVWLLDSSHSLVDDRKRVAARLTPFYQQLVEERTEQSHELVSAVVSYGNSMRERVAPTKFGDEIVRAVEALPIDRSGNEKVFRAVDDCARHYRESWKDKQFAIVIWTDESGDDLPYLEEAIATCRRNHVSVSVVGPSSVLGADTGLHSYTDPKLNATYQIPVRRGPDSAMSERLELGYWYLTRWGRRGGRRGPLPSWLGGQDLQGILSGFSPYALTRLSMRTGGTYTVFDRPEDRGPFNPAAMLRYAPSYESMEEYRDSVRSGPLRAAVMNAVKVLDGKKVDAPPTMLFIKSTGPRVFDFMRYYHTPSDFQAKLRSARGRLKGQASRYSNLVESALKKVSHKGDPETGLDEFYQYEQSPRWRAWYDLTRGRLLATSVRLEEYRLTLDHVVKPGVLAGSTNHIVLIASPEKRSSGKFVQRAEEAEALLRRCVRENEGTPWESLAQRELDFALGVGVSERALSLENAGPAPKQPNLPRF